MLIHELVFNKKAYSKNIFGFVKLIFGKSLPQFAWLPLKWLEFISHVASVI